MAFEPAHVIDDDPLDAGQRVTHGEDLVGLFLVLDQDEARLAVVKDEPHVLRQAVHEDPDRDGTGRLRGELGIEPGRAIARDHRELVAALEPELEQSQAHGAHVRRVRVPGDLLPDPVLLLAQGDLVAGKAPGLRGEHARQRQLIRGERYPTGATSKS